jgi:hypothetical protein
MSKKGSPLAWVIVGLIAVGTGFIVQCNGNNSQKPSRNRVPTLQDQADSAQRNAKDAKAAADQVQQMKQDIQSQIDKLNSTQRNTSGELKEGRPETTAPGAISDFGAFKIETGGPNDSASDDYYLGFTFTDRSGFTKRFFPVCPNQTVKLGTTLTIMYHWRTWHGTGSGQRGCYQLDGFQQ